MYVWAQLQSLDKTKKQGAKNHYNQIELGTQKTMPLLIKIEIKRRQEGGEKMPLNNQPYCIFTTTKHL